jgi:hypothetical protein
MPVDRYRFSVTLFVIATFAAGIAIADGGHCARCGSSGPCQRVCRLVTEEKAVQITCFGCKCEEFCLPGTSKPGCEHCELVCGTCDKCREPDAVYAAPKRFVWTQWVPSSAKINTKKKLMKKTITKKVPSHRWVVEELCDHCAQYSQTPIVPLNILAERAPSR